MFPKTGTREWSDHSANIQVGCEHGCRYCYARNNAVGRFKTVKSDADWLIPRPTPKPGHGHRTGIIMFPTTHDITPANIGPAVKFITETLANRNQMLIVTKPHTTCIEAICEAVINQGTESQIMFRFTIGSVDDADLSFWEPRAPNFMERFRALAIAYSLQFKTSVSAEPLLGDPYALYKMLSPFITDQIWFGKMNHMRERINKHGWSDADDAFWCKVFWLYNSDKCIWKLYNTYRNNPKVAWKDSYKSVLGL